MSISADDPSRTLVGGKAHRWSAILRPVHRIAGSEEAARALDLRLFVAKAIMIKS
jgi:hypothetical protein